MVFHLFIYFFAFLGVIFKTPSDTFPRQTSRLKRVCVFYHLDGKDTKIWDHGPKKKLLKRRKRDPRWFTAAIFIHTDSRDFGGGESQHGVDQATMTYSKYCLIGEQQQHKRRQWGYDSNLRDKDSNEEKINREYRKIKRPPLRNGRPLSSVIMTMKKKPPKHIERLRVFIYGFMIVSIAHQLWIIIRAIFDGREKSGWHHQHK